MSTDNNTEISSTNKSYRGAMKRAMDYINSAATIRGTPEQLASELGVPGMTAYRALRTAVSQGIMKVEKLEVRSVTDGKKSRGPNKNVFVKVG